VGIEGLGRGDAGGAAEGDDPPLLSVLMPVYDEVATVETIVERVLAVDLDKEIVIVDDGSTDGTRAVLERLAARHGPLVRVILQPENRGKGAALREAIRHARGRISIVQDADLEYDPSDYPALVAPILAGRTNVVYGSRPLCAENHYPLDVFRMGSLFLTVLTNLLYVCHLTDEPTCYKVFRTDLLRSLPLRCRGFEFCPEVTAKVRRRGERILEVPIRYRKRSVEEGKKIRFRDALVGAWTLVRHRFAD
jgi:glycosyltransferase involved in cell wall biosynthesis